MTKVTVYHECPLRGVVTTVHEDCHAVADHGVLLIYKNGIPGGRAIAMYGMDSWSSATYTGTP